MIVDAHHHLWDPRTRAYPWMPAELAAPFTLDDLRRVTQEAGVGRTVLVQTVSDLAETQEFLDVAAASGGLVAGVVGWVDHTRDVPQQVAGLRHRDLLKGVRHQVEDEADPDWLRRPEVVAALGSVGDLVVDLLVRWDQLPAAVDLAERCPQTSFVLDHGAKPPLGTPDLAAWRDGVSRLAAQPNVTGKLSGLFTLAHQDRLAPAVDHLLDAFGPGRLVFGTDWPVSTLAHDYRTVVERTRSLLDPLDEADRAAVLAGNAVRTYRL
ncbi:amidohydrolase family protein [Kineococcus rhizosphaerae]|uniref:L-fuconolactonase n=1 Tax=Kineococcus rhizosphaerae TaxID=559628 RepID=A0A2T0R0M9_9ACTN|nr:amidohydrolase family protein [Kineococcus rhizosphaerae]PRY12848.1 L-fuconolactonase [Kineococcus rhizosphaerae]